MGPSEEDNCLLSDYIEKIISDKAEIKLLFYGDFNGDQEQEIILGYQIENEEFYSNFKLLYFYKDNGVYAYRKVLSSDYEEKDSIYQVDGVYDGAYAVETNGDGLAELVLALTMGNGHFVKPYILSFNNNNISCWSAFEEYAHGQLAIIDDDHDGVYDLLIEYSTYSSEEELTGNSEAGPHIRASIRFSWDGITYGNKSSYLLNPRYKVYNSAAAFLYSIWKEDYQRAVRYAEIPLILGLKGLDGDTFSLFKGYVLNEIRPTLISNLEENCLTYEEGSLSYCSFKGNSHLFNLELLPGQKIYKITAIKVVPTS